RGERSFLLSSHPNLDLAVLLAHFVRGERFGCGTPQNGARGDVILGTVALAHERRAREQSCREGAALVFAQIVKGVQFASGARAGDTALEILQVIGVNVVIGQLARVVEGAERYSSRHLVSLLSGFGVKDSSKIISLRPSFLGHSQEHSSKSKNADQE